MTEQGKQDRLDVDLTAALEISSDHEQTDSKAMDAVEAPASHAVPEPAPSENLNAPNEAFESSVDEHTALHWVPSEKTDEADLEDISPQTVAGHPLRQDADAEYAETSPPPPDMHHQEVEEEGRTPDTEPALDVLEVSKLLDQLDGPGSHQPEVQAYATDADSTDASISHPPLPGDEATVFEATPEQSIKPDFKTIAEVPSEDTVLLDPTSHDQLMAMRAHVDEVTVVRPEHHAVVMFTDLADSTGYYERHGDYLGRQKILHHNAIIFPIIKRFGGDVVKTLGDGLMVHFQELSPALATAEEIQGALLDYNRSVREKDEQIHVRIGLHAGNVIEEKGDLHGDTVNVAARLQSEADADEVLLSEAVAESLPPEKWERLGEVSLKGRAQPITIYRLRWSKDSRHHRRPPDLLERRYRIQEMIGQGPTGIIYSGIDERLAQPVAIKFFHRNVIESEKTRDLLHTFLTQVATIQHPNILPVYDAVLADTVQPYAVAGYCEGVNLAVWRRQNKKVSSEMLLHIAEQLAEALRFAHTKEVFHGNLKPENVLIEREHTVRLSYFGLRDLNSIMEPNSQAGIAVFQAPEQRKGQPADALTDIWGWGAVLYFLWSGDAPDALRPEGTTRSLQAAFRRGQRKKLPSVIEKLLMSALSTERSERPLNFEDVLSKLRRQPSSAQGGMPDVPYKSQSMNASLATAWKRHLRRVPGGRYLYSLPRVYLTLATLLSSTLAVLVLLVLSLVLLFR